MNEFVSMYKNEIDTIKTLIKRELGFMPKSNLPEDILEEVYSHGYGHPDLIPAWEEELANPRTTYQNPFSGGECPIDPEWIEARKVELRGFIKYNRNRRQIPHDLNKKLDWLIGRQIEWEESSPYYDEEDLISMRVGLQDTEDDTPDWWFERG